MRVHHRPAGLARLQCVEVGGGPGVFAQAVVAPVQVVPLQRRLGLELLNEMAVPVHATHEGRQTLAQACRQGGVLRLEQHLLPLRGLHHFAHAQAAQRQIGRKARAGRGRRQR